jgi:hypothetical protein
MRAKEEGQYIKNSRGVFVKAKQFLRSLLVGHEINLGKRILGKNSKDYRYLSACKRPKTAELLVVVPSDDIKSPYNIIQISLAN